MTNKKDSDSISSEFETKVNDAKVVRKIVFMMLASFTLIILIGVISGYFYIKSALQPVDGNSDEEIVFEVPMGSTSSNIATTLEENGLIKNSKIFRFYVKFKNFSDFQAGEYALSPSLSMEEIIRELQQGRVMEEPVHRLTIPEGKAVEEIAKLVDKHLNVSEKEFLSVAQDEAFLEELMESYPMVLTKDILNKEVIEPLEGYLFAGTYDVFEEEPTAESLITMMVEQTNQVLTKELEAIEDQELTPHQVLTLASIVERESMFEEDRPKVAQVFMNRIADNMKLQSDITAAYANGEHKIVMTYDDIGVDSPYNTYVQEGLPPGPIASPSTNAIKAVIQPEGNDFDYIYFYARPSGETYYTKTLDEHKEIIEKYRQEWYDLEKENKNKKKKEK